MFGVPSASRKVLSGSRAAGLLAAAVAARRRSSGAGSEHPPFEGTLQGVLKGSSGDGGG